MCKQGKKSTCCYMNTFRTKILTYGGKKRRNPSLFFHCCFYSGIAHANRSILCLQKKKREKKTQKNQKKTLQEMAVKITPMHKDPTPPRYRSLEPVFPYQAWGLISFFFFFFFLRVHSSSLVLVHRSLNMQARGRNDVPFLFLFHLKLFIAVHWNLLIIHVYVRFFSAISSVDLC